jgi:serine/threonine protein kinase
VPQRAVLTPLRRWDPEQIGGYRLLGRLGAGAMGQVYLGRSAAGRLVAVKTIKAELAEEPDFRTRFAQEVAAARRVSGAFTAAVVASDSEADLPWLATAYVPAPSLSRLVAECGPLPVPAVCWLAAGCAEALESIHAAGLVHRDLKPSNVLISPDGPRVIDFGVARAAERIQLTVTRGAVGTPAYMAPEQARDTRQATTASDVFSLGATMLFAATGHAPYQGETVMDVLVRLATEPPDLTGLPPDLAWLVHACLERDPRKRPASASVLARLAPTVAEVTNGYGGAPLSGEALSLIDAYRQDPVPADSVQGETGEESTFGSLPADGAPARLAISRAPGRRQSAARPTDRARRRPGRRRALGLVLASAAVAAGLLASGAVIGVSISDSRPPPPPQGSTLPPPPPGTGQAAGPSSAQPTSQRPRITLSQGQGDGYTGFVVYGEGWPPGRRVTITLAGIGSSPIHPTADGAGTFSYTINQGHEFFPGALPLGTYRVTVTGAGGILAAVSFMVNHKFRPSSGPR